MAIDIVRGTIVNREATDLLIRKIEDISHNIEGT